MSERACPVVLAAPSGTGKTTLARRLVAASPDFVFSTSATTRGPRDGERHGEDYDFLSRPDFVTKADRGDFAEWAEVHGHLYGTPRAMLDAAAERGEHVVLDIDVQGARQIRESVPGAKLIFVLPPDVPTLLRRLTGRGTETPEDVATRLRSALVELGAVADFDYVVVNDELERCLATIRSIVAGGGESARRDVSARKVDDLRAEIHRVLDEEYAEYTNATS